MHALFVVTELDSSRWAEAETMLKSRLVPQIKQAPGFVSGTWARSADGKEARSIVVFETEEAARATATRIREGMPPEGPAKVISTNVHEVVHQA